MSRSPGPRATTFLASSSSISIRSAGINEETSVLDDVLEELGELSRRSTVEIPMGSDKPARERALHRLVVLGVVRDYLVEWGPKAFVVEVAGVDSDDVVDHLLEYVGRSQPGPWSRRSRSRRSCSSARRERSGRRMRADPDRVRLRHGRAFLLDGACVRCGSRRAQERCRRERHIPAADPRLPLRGRHSPVPSNGSWTRRISATTTGRLSCRRSSARTKRASSAAIQRGSWRRTRITPDVFARGFSQLADDRGNVAELVVARGLACQRGKSIWGRVLGRRGAPRSLASGRGGPLPASEARTAVVLVALEAERGFTGGC